MKRICAAFISEYDCELPYTIYEYDLSPLTTDAGVFDILDTVEDCLWMMYQSKNVHVISQMTLTALMKTLPDARITFLDQIRSDGRTHGYERSR